ncbi:acetyltransferase, GNAT family protein [Pelomyxa schiedti]|nr:acetyltransferase, GNAT family protein [Pelomyxa schiedti]
MGSNVGTTTRSSSPPSQGGELDVHCGTDARDQFVALATGAVVGRCGARSALRALTPYQVSQLGRDWVVHASLHVVLDLGIRFKPKCVTVAFSVSPTLGLVDRPAVVARGCYGKFQGWVGPLSAGQQRFALMALRGQGNRAGESLCVVEIARGWQSGVNALCGCGARFVANSRRWLAVVSYVRQVGYQMELWNFDQVEAGVVPKVDEAIPFPREVARMKFARNAADSLVVSKRDGIIQVIGMEATWEQKRIVVTREFGPYHNLQNPMCWNGMMYMITDITEGSIVCLTTGETFNFSGCFQLSFIGGPYFLLDKFGFLSGFAMREVRSIVEPTRVCYTHSAKTPKACGVLEAGQEIVVRAPLLGLSDQDYIEVFDSVSGFLIFKISNPESAQNLILLFAAVRPIMSSDAAPASASTTTPSAPPAVSVSASASASAPTPAAPPKRLELPITLVEVTPKNIEQVRVINLATLPVTYNDKFYSDLLLNPSKFNRLAYYGEDVIAGSICCRLEPIPGTTYSKLYIMTLGVLEAYSRLKIGTKLLQYMLTSCVDGVAQLYLHVQSSNVRAIAFYERLGFKRGPMLENYYKKIEPPHCYILTKDIKDIPELHNKTN